MHGARHAINRRIIIVDDNRDIHKDFDKVLAPILADESSIEDLDADLFGDAPPDKPQGLCFDLDHAMQGEEAVEMIKKALADKAPYAVAFVDMRMPPGWDGLDTIENVWKVDTDIQVVICTAYADHSLEQIVERLGITDNLFFLKKPFDSVEVAQLANALTVKWDLAKKADYNMRLMEQQLESRTSQLNIAVARNKITSDS
jgi:CheY-like chemotaxis protein